MSFNGPQCRSVAKAQCDGNHASPGGREIVMAAVKKGRRALEGDREVAMAAIKHDRSRYNRSVTKNMCATFYQ